LSVFLQAKGTLAGTSISNQAQIAYAVGGIDNNLTSNTDEFVVDRVVDIHINWQDSTSVKVGAGDQDRVLTFMLTNLGNGDDNATLSYEHNASSDFAPINSTLYQDTNGNGIFDPGVDTVASNIGLAADANKTLFLVADIPNDANVSDRSYDGILAISDSSATAGADNPSAVDVVVRKGSDRDQGIYEVRDYWLESRKSAVVHSDDNATHTGTRVTYTIDLWIGGSSSGKSITNVKIADVIPSGTTYVSGSLKLDGTSLSDPADSDAGSCDGATIKVNVGTIGGTAHKKVSFDVTVQ
jgi:uncharacterized repeat protein (TIGR01451 family)